LTPVRPRIRKLGTLACHLVETTPFVFGGEVYRLEWVRTSHEGNRLGEDDLRVVERGTGREVSAFGEGYRFPCAYVEGGKVHVAGTKTQDGWYGHTVTIFAPGDLKTWRHRTALDDPKHGICNTSIRRAGEKYVMMFEIHAPAAEAGTAFTGRFATARNISNSDIGFPKAGRR
jgi:hypothetical protein